jgi:hypothetical protein
MSKEDIIALTTKLPRLTSRRWTTPPSWRYPARPRLLALKQRSITDRTFAALAAMSDLI